MRGHSRFSAAEGGRRAGIPEKVIERLAFYRRVLILAAESGKTYLFSHEIAAISEATSAQVRRDLMEVGYLGHPRHGYEIAGLLRHIESFLSISQGVRLAVVGVGNLGRAILFYFSGRAGSLTVEAAFDSDPTKVGRVIHGCRCYPVERLAEIVGSRRIEVGVIAVPASEAQNVADQLIEAGARGILNLAPARLRVPEGVFVENVDLTLAIEKVGFFSKFAAKQEEDLK